MSKTNLQSISLINFEEFNVFVFRRFENSMAVTALCFWGASFKNTGVKYALINKNCKKLDLQSFGSI